MAKQKVAAGGSLSDQVQQMRLYLTAYLREKRLALERVDTKSDSANRDAVVSSLSDLKDAGDDLFGDWE